MVACGAIAMHVKEIAARRGFAVTVKPLPPLLHNRPERIAAAVEIAAREALRSYDAVAVGYGDCGTNGALDEVCERLGIARLEGSHCYDIFAGMSRMEQLMTEEPGTYVLTDYLVRSFHRSVIVELGLDRYPELRDDYFRHYSRAVWLAQAPSPELYEAARAAANAIELELTVEFVGDEGLERAIESLLTAVGRSPAGTPASSTAVPGEVVANQPA